MAIILLFALLIDLHCRLKAITITYFTLKLSCIKILQYNQSRGIKVMIVAILIIYAAQTMKVCRTVTPVPTKACFEKQNGEISMIGSRLQSSNLCSNP